MLHRCHAIVAALSLSTISISPVSAQGDAARPSVPQRDGITKAPLSERDPRYMAALQIAVTLYLPELSRELTRNGRKMTALEERVISGISRLKEAFDGPKSTEAVEAALTAELRSDLVEFGAQIQVPNRSCPTDPLGILNHFHHSVLHRLQSRKQ